MPFIRSCPQCGQKNRIPAKHLADTGRCGACKSPLPPAGEPLELDREQFEELLHQARVPILVDFWADWCGPCKMAAPEVARTASDMAGRAIVAKVDTERYPDLAARYNVRGIPNFVVFYGGRPVMQQAGVADHQQMESWLQSAAQITTAH
jgi:thioredoxin 2